MHELTPLEVLLARHRHAQHGVTCLKTRVFTLLAPIHKIKPSTSPT